MSCKERGDFKHLLSIYIDHMTIVIRQKQILLNLKIEKRYIYIVFFMEKREIYC